MRLPYGQKIAHEILWSAIGIQLVFQSCDKAPHKFYCFVTNWAVQEPGLYVVLVEFEKVRLILELSHFVAENFVKPNTRY